MDQNGPKVSHKACEGASRHAFELAVAAGTGQCPVRQADAARLHVGCSSDTSVALPFVTCCEPELRQLGLVEEHPARSCQAH